MAPSVTWWPRAGRLASWRCGRGERVVFVHGFTQTSQSWRAIAETVAGHGYECVIVDLPGHGGSGGVRADLRTGGDLLAESGPAVYVAYSLGGRYALHMALAHPAMTRALMVIGANPGIDDELERARRRAADERTAQRIAEIGVEAFLDEWVQLPLFGGVPLDAADRAARLTNTVDGLVSSLRLAGVGSQLSLWPRLAELNMPVVALAGSRDERYSAIGRQLARRVPNAAFYEVPGAAHAAHLHRPDEVTRRALDLLRSPRP